MVAGDVANAPGLPHHVVIIMDGNGRWAKQHQLPRAAGHRAGVEAAREIVRACARKGIEVLTLFAFSSENWRRPKQEVGLLMELFVTALQDEADQLNENNVRLRIIGDRHALPLELQRNIGDAERLTTDNSGLTLVIAANYGGRWDISVAARALAREVATVSLAWDEVTAELVHSRLSLSDLPEPDLFIRTGGEQRISNFLSWQLAYTELYFTDCLWPDFDPTHLEQALAAFSKRQRRFGRTGEQVERLQGA
jgi:undecaprenyl diphosphate synthase